MRPNENENEQQKAKLGDPPPSAPPASQRFPWRSSSRLSARFTRKTPNPSQADRDGPNRPLTLTITAILLRSISLKQLFTWLRGPVRVRAPSWPHSRRPNRARSRSGELFVASKRGRLSPRLCVCSLSNLQGSSRMMSGRLIQWSAQINMLCVPILASCWAPS